MAKYSSLYYSREQADMIYIGTVAIMGQWTKDCVARPRVSMRTLNQMEETFGTFVIN